MMTIIIIIIATIIMIIPLMIATISTITSDDPFMTNLNLTANLLRQKYPDRPPNQQVEFKLLSQ